MRKNIFYNLLFILLFLTIFSISNTVFASQFSVKRKAIGINSTFDLKTIITDSKGLKYNSSDEEVVSVSDDGIITGNKMGYADIEITDKNNLKNKIQITVGYYTGIDISGNNHDINWENVQKDGIDFAYIRSSWGWYDPVKDSDKEYNFQFDKYLSANVEGCIKNNIPFGIYHYSYAETIEQAILEAKYTLDALKSVGDYAKEMSLPIIYDMEATRYVSSDVLTDVVLTYCNKIKEAGYEVMVYANKNWFTKYLNFDRLMQSDLEFWYSVWPPEPNFNEEIQIGTSGIVPHIWQYTDSGIIEGIDNSNGTVDMNVMYMSKRIKVSFYDENNLISSKIIKKGNNIKLPEVTKDGYIFKGWKNQNNEVVNSDTVFNEDTTLKADFELIPVINSINFNVSNLTLKSGKTYKLNVSYLPQNTTADKSLKWSTTDESVANVSDDGTITAIGTGNCEIVATSIFDPTKQTKCSLNVVDYILGDYDDSGLLNVTDAYLMLLSIVNEEEITQDKLSLIDMDNSGKIDVTDAFLILQNITSNL